jgi:hypothetical protein
MPFSVAVLCVLCVFVVKPLSVAVPHRSSFIPHRSHRVAARMSTTPCLKGVRHSTDVGHQCRTFSTLRAPSLSVSNLAAHDMINRNVNKCTYLYRQLPLSTLFPAKKRAQCG